MSRLLLLVYFASGLGAVAVETVWMRWLRALLGATAPAASATLVAFFVGFAIGAAWSSRRSSRTARPLALYGRLELAAAAGALAVPLLLAVGERALALGYDTLRETPAALTLARFAIALVASFPAAFCFGATFPAIAAATVGAPRDLGARGGALYATNTLGAALGCAMATFLLPGWIGVRATYAVAIAFLGAAGAAALLLSRKSDVLEPEASEVHQARVPIQPEVAVGLDARQQELQARTRAQRKRARKQAERAATKPAHVPLPSLRSNTRSLGARGLLAIATGSGFGVFALQVLLVQAFAQVSNQSIYAFGAVLIGVLLAIASAGALVALLERRSALDARGLVGLALVAAALALACFPALLARTTDGFAYVGAGGGGLAYFGALLATVATTAGAPLFATALVFPATLAAAGRSDAEHGAGAIVGRLVAWNTAGAIAGAIAAPYELVPRFGLWPAFAALSLLYGVAAVFVPETDPRWRIRRDLALFVGWLIIGVRASPLGVPLVALGPNESLLALDSTPAAVVAVVERDGERLIRIDNHYALGGTAERIHHERQSHLPLLLAPHAKRVAYVGSATGISAGGALAHPIESLFLVELVPGVADAAARWFGDANRGVYRDPRTHVVVDDARNFLRLTRERFDLVVADLFVPWQAGAGSLYTREHFEAVRAHLAPGGAFCQWLPLYQLGEPELTAIAATFLDVFPQSAVFRGDFYGRFPIAALVGWSDAPPSPAAIAVATERLAGIGDRWVADPLGPWSLYVGPLAPLAQELAAAPRNTDDRPLVERDAAATHAGGNAGKLDPIVGPRWIAWSERLRTATARAVDPLFSLDERQQRAVDGGFALQVAGADYVTGQVAAASAAFAEASRSLPPNLVSEAAADPTAAELWTDE